jgi:hypothetical protein
MNDDARQQVADVLDQLLIGNLSCADLGDRLLSGDCSNGDICDLLYENFENDLEPYKLIKLTEEERLMVWRCVVFLRSKADYKWPDYPREGLLSTLCFPLLYVGAPAAIVWFITSMFISYSATRWILVIPGLGLIVLLWMVRRKLDNDAERWKSVGDFSVWPFLCESDYSEALRQQRGEGVS